MPVLALPALLALDIEPPRHSGQVLRRDRLVFSLDGAIVVGSLFILTWATALGAVVHAETPNVPALAVAIAYPLTDLILVVIVVLLIATGRVPRQLRPQLWLLGAGLVAISVSDSIFAYLVSSGADAMPPLTNAGFIAGPLHRGCGARHGGRVARGPPPAPARGRRSRPPAVVVAPQRSEASVTADALVHRADSAMYAGKRRGKGIAVHYRPDAIPDVRPGPRRAGPRGRPGASRTVPEFPAVAPDVSRRRSGIGSVTTPTP